MSLENAIETLAASISQLALAVASANSEGGVLAPTAEAGEADPPAARRGRPRKDQTATQIAATNGQPAGADTGSPASGSTSDDAAAPAEGSAPTNENPPVIDAGTGKPADVDPKAFRAEIKTRGVRLTQLVGGNARLTELLKAHSPEGAAVKFGSVPDENMAAFGEAIDQAIAELEQLAD